MKSDATPSDTHILRRKKCCHILSPRFNGRGLGEPPVEEFVVLGVGGAGKEAEIVSLVINASLDAGKEEGRE